MTGASTMGVGALRHRVSLERPVDTPDGAGGASRAWTPVADLWAAIAPVSASERLEAEALEATATHRVRIRHRADVTSAMRFVLGARIFRIETVSDPDQRRRWRDCLCREIDREDSSGIGP